MNKSKWPLLSLVSFLCFPFLFYFENRYFKAHESYFCCPVFVTASRAAIRNDEIGKGAFGSPRSGSRLHEGIDFLSPAGSPVFAACSGRVSFSGTGRGYGNYIKLAHPNGLETRYAHLEEVLVKDAQWVRRGDVIGSVGKTGNADREGILPHLHFEIRSSERVLNPSEGLLDPSLILS